MKKTSSKLFVVPYMLWIALFVLAPLVLIFGQSFFNIEGQFSLENYKSYFASQISPQTACDLRFRLTSL